MRPVVGIHTILWVFVSMLLCVQPVLGGDFSAAVDAKIMSESGLSSIEDQLILWLDAKNINGNNNVGLGNNVSSWLNLANGQYQSGQNATYATDAVVFNGSSTRFSVDISGLLNSNYTIFSVHKKTNTSRAYILSTGGNKSTYNRTDKKLMFGYNAYPGTWLASIYNNRFTVDHYGNPASFDNNMPTNQIITTVGRLDSSTAPYRHAFINGVKKDPETGTISGHTLVAPTNAKLLNTNEAYVGYGHGNSYFKGEMYELLVFKDALSDAEIAKIQYYLSKKWNLEGTMDSDGDGVNDDTDTNIMGLLPDFSKVVDEQIGIASGFDSLESSLKLWLDAKNVKGNNNAHISNGDAVERWTDLSGEGNHATRSSASLQPEFKTNSFPLTSNTNILKKPTVEFDGADSLIVLNSSNQNFRMDNMTIFVVGVNNGSAGWGNTFISKGGEGAVAGWAMRHGGGDIRVNFWAGGDSLSNTSDSQLNAVFILSLEKQSNTKRKLWINTHENLDLDSTSTSFSFSNVPLTIGNISKSTNGDIWHAARGLTGLISEILVFDSLLTETQQIKIMHYLSKKWSLTTVIDSDGDGNVDSNDTADPMGLGPVNTAPTVSDVTGSGKSGTAIDATLLGTDTETDDNNLTYSIITTNNGTVSVSGATVTYTPNPGFVGTDTFTYKANDGTVDSGSAATVTITVLPDFSSSVDAEIGSASGFDNTFESKLQLWLDASSTDYIVKDAYNNVSEWKDLSGNGNHALQTTSSKQPVYTSNTITLEGSNNPWLRIADSDGLRIGQGAGKEFTVIALYNATKNNNSAILSKRGPASSTYTDYTLYISSATKFYFGTGSSSDAGAWKSINPNPSINNKHIAVGTLASTGEDSGTKELYIDGQEKFSVSYNQKAAATDDYLYLGAIRNHYTNENSLSKYYKGDYHEILIFNKALSDTERAKVTYYLSKKWGLTAIMDSDGDGFTDAAEIAAGSDPILTSSIPNTAPTVSDVTGSGKSGTEIDATLSGSDSDGDSLTYSIITTNNGTVSVSGATATYTPNAGFVGTDTFTYKANDGTVDSSSTATVTITVLPDLSDKIDTNIGNSHDSSSIITGFVEDDVIFWLDAQNVDKSANSTHSHLDPITTWHDLSGKGNDAKQDVDNDFRPKVFIDSGNQKNTAVQFNLTGTLEQNLTLGNKYLFADANHSGMTIIAVAEPTGTTLDDEYLLSFGAQDHASIGLRVSKSKFGILSPKSDGGDVGSVSISLATSNIVSVRYEFGSNQKGYVNGAEEISQTITLPEITASTIAEAPVRSMSYADGPVSIGAESKGHRDKRDPGVRIFKGGIKEFLVFKRALSEQEFAQVNYYLSKKWGLESKMDSDGDGFTDAAEIAGGSDPILTSSFPNTAPTVSNVTGSGKTGAGIDVTLLGTDTETDDNNLTYSIITTNNGTVSVSGATATYTPNAGFVGTDTFTYKANDGTVDSSSTATVTITVLPDFSSSVDAEIATASGFDDIEPSLKLWLDASSTDYIVKDGNNNVSEWKDLSGSDHHVSQSNGSRQPIYSTSGGGSLDFNASGRGLVMQNSDDIINDELTIVSVVNVVTFSGNSNVVAKSKNLAYRFRVEKNKNLWLLVNDTGSNLEGKEGNSLTEEGENIIGVTYEGGDTKKIKFKDKNEVVEVATSKASINDISGNLVIGNYDDGHINEYFHGTISEILLFNKTLTDEELAKVYYYLSKKWGLESTIDSDGDGFTDAAEISASTNPMDASSVPDSDGDGVNDDADAFPNNAAAAVDSDDDGYPDSFIGTHTHLVGDATKTIDKFANDAAAAVDSDDDGYPDSFITGTALSNGKGADAFPNDGAAAVDADGDGYPDEWVSGKSSENSTTGLNLDSNASDANSSIDTLTVVPEFTVASGKKSDLFAWFVGDSKVVQKEADKVKRWVDISGNGYHFNQSNAGLRPTYDTEKTAMVFDGNTYMELTQSKPANKTVFIVATGSGGLFGDSSTYIAPEAGSVKIGGGADANPEDKSNSDISSTQKNIYVLRDNNSLVRVRFGMFQLLSKIFGARKTSDTSMYLGKSPRSEINNFIGDVYEVIVYQSVLDDDAVEEIHNELSLRWDIGSSKPTIVMVDQAHSGDTKGTSERPLKKLKDALRKVFGGGKVKMKKGSYPDPVSITENVIIEATDGPVILGVPKGQ